jgi:hypothetical protein
MNEDRSVRTMSSRLESFDSDDGSNLKDVAKMESADSATAVGRKSLNFEVVS